MSTRREFITLLGGAAAALPLAARAQQSQPLRRIGHLRAGLPPERELQALLRGLSENGYVQGRNYVLVTQWGDGNVARLPELAVALVNAGSRHHCDRMHHFRACCACCDRHHPDCLHARRGPVRIGLIKSLARPGGNITGFSSLNVDIAGKTLETLKEIVPGFTKVATLAPRQVWGFVFCGR